MVFSATAGDLHSATARIGRIGGVGATELGSFARAWVCCHLVLGGVADELLAVLRECNPGRRYAIALVVWDDLDLQSSSHAGRPNLAGTIAERSCSFR
jgi:hypothetical protein